MLALLQAFPGRVFTASVYRCPANFCNFVERGAIKRVPTLVVMNCGGSSGLIQVYLRYCSWVVEREAGDWRTSCVLSRGHARHVNLSSLLAATGRCSSV